MDMKGKLNDSSFSFSSIIFNNLSCEYHYVVKRKMVKRKKMSTARGPTLKSGIQSMKNIRNKKKIQNMTTTAKQTIAY